MELKRVVIFNFAYFGGQRESVNLSGHFTAITDMDEFVFFKHGDYLGFTTYEPMFESRDLTDSEYRLANDYVREHLKSESFVSDATNEDIKLFNELKRYKYSDKTISANITYGDKVINLFTNEVFEINHDRDVNYINRNFNYKLVDRDLHPKENTLSEFKKVLSKVNPFDGWDVCELPKNGLSNYHGDYIIDNQKYKMNSHSKTDTYYITTPEGITYSKKSSISAPFYDCIDLLTGFVFMEYIDGTPHYHVVKECEHKPGKTDIYSPTRFKLFNDEKSYRYNTRMTYL